MVIFNNQYNSIRRALWCKWVCGPFFFLFLIPTSECKITALHKAHKIQDLPRTKKTSEVSGTISEMQLSHRESSTFSIILHLGWKCWMSGYSLPTRMSHDFCNLKLKNAIYLKLIMLSYDGFPLQRVSQANPLFFLSPIKYRAINKHKV